MAEKRKRRRKPLANGRDGEGQYLRISYRMAQSDAWRSLTGSGLKVFIELRCRYNGGNNGKLALSMDEAARLLGMSKATVQRALKELEAKGFIVLTKKGQWYGRQATEWRVTDCSCNGYPASNDWRNWRSEKIVKNSPPVLSRDDEAA